MFLETRILPWLRHQDFRENCNPRQCFLQCVFHQVILIKQTRFWVKLQCDFSHKAGKLKPIFSHFTLKTIRNHVKIWTNLPAVEENAWQKMNTKRPAITIRSEAIFTIIWQQIQTEIFRSSEVVKPFFKKRSIRKSSLVFSEIMHDAVVPRLCSVTMHWGGVGLSTTHLFIFSQKFRALAHWRKTLFLSF